MVDPNKNPPRKASPGKQGATSMEGAIGRIQ